MDGMMKLTGWRAIRSGKGPRKVIDVNLTFDRDSDSGSLWLGVEASDDVQVVGRFTIDFDSEEVVELRKALEQYESHYTPEELE